VSAVRKQDGHPNESTLTAGLREIFYVANTDIVIQAGDYLFWPLPFHDSWAYDPSYGELRVSFEPELYCGQNINKGNVYPNEQS